MILRDKSLEKLRILINEQTEYRSGPELIKFFKSLGFNDSYGQGFPSRWKYTDDRLMAINGKSELDKCIKILFSPANFINRLSDLDALITDFNQYLVFDKWQVVRDNADITFKKLDKIELHTPKEVVTENEFLKREFSDISVNKIGLESSISEVLQQRIDEISKCYKAEAPLATILLAGSTIEGILLGLATKYPKQFNTSKASPKDSSGKTKQFHDWSLTAFIDVAKDLDLIHTDTYKFSHALRDFRNYIHPFAQMTSGFNPRTHTAKICLQVLKAAIHDINENLPKIGT